MISVEDGQEGSLCSGRSFYTAESQFCLEESRDDEVDEGEKEAEEKEEEERIVAKALHGQRYPMPLCLCM